MHSRSNISNLFPLKWNNSPKGEGILIAADEAVEWLLPWWWSRLQATNCYPVCFVDIGLSHFGRSFCQARGEVIDLKIEASFSDSSADCWETLFGKEWKKSRGGWFKKPFAFLASPFEKTLWLDVDCEVVRPLDPLFKKEGEIYLMMESEPTHARERGLQTIQEDEVLYNSGVVLYQHGCGLVEKWAEAVLREGEQFCSDQHVLSHVAHHNSYPVHFLEREYNWRMVWGLNIEAVIVHWAGSWGKEYIRKYGGIADELDSIRIAPRDGAD